MASNYVPVGSSAPDFRAPTSNGQTLDRSSFLDKIPVALAFPDPELAEHIPLHALTLLADQDGSIREAYGPDGGQCFVIDTVGIVRAIVPLGANAVDDVLNSLDRSLHAEPPDRSGTR